MAVSEPVHLFRFFASVNRAKLLLRALALNLRFSIALAASFRRLYFPKYSLLRIFDNFDSGPSLHHLLVYDLNEEGCLTGARISTQPGQTEVEEPI